MDPVPVLVVGAGPVGMVTALALARHGVACVLVDQGFETSVHPKLDYVNARSMEFFRQFGLADDVRAAGVAPEHRSDVIWSTGLAGEPITRWGLPSVTEEWRRIAEHNDGTQPAEPGQRISQIDLEPVLRARCRREPLVDLRLGVRFDSLTQDDAAVTSVLADDTGGEVRLRSRYVVGCDGASSRVRRAVGIGEEGFDVPGLPGAFMVHFTSRDLDSLHRHGRFWHYFAFRYVIIAQDEVDTWTAHVNGIDPNEFDEPPADPEAFLLDTIRTELRIDKVLLTSRWRPGFMLADRYRAGRVLLAGDSAHRMFPTGAYGMNTGIGDAVDVAWKLAAVLRGFGGPALLDSYDAERRPVGRRNMHTSHRHLGVHLRAGELLRDGAPLPSVAAFLDAERGENEYRGIELGYRYAGSPVLRPEGPAEPPDDPRAYTPTTWPGARPPSLLLSGGQQIFDRFDPASFTLVDFTGDGAADPLLAAAAARGLPVTHTVVTDARARELWERDLVLLRPDHHVAWRGNTAPPDPDAVVQRVRGGG
ncbi:2-polyprenyl-6-methoxyphenol hydroxylase-like FAD-dependent oxidoreductase [Micromonospora sp. HB375]|uniref:FAD-dependent monooxygenase n=1 Tax=Micromonospora TaxID=1873 RepID=UPI001AE3EAB6|nr:MULTISPECIES: FAD-dependent monooxygenase [unclassified Micromonospora]MBP1784107.1 2-polyprenyl-6-methoxyphenol hydroxylase-like FAD-dependent oxidoreductase [Micromonospora sp. HB375]MDH6467099.1 2-polyprenyl-6-methoxyphenol hydroxylase-like FAD-dependent oxidoreductase [Micromonospora sp. H404/HB375]